MQYASDVLNVATVVSLSINTKIFNTVPIDVCFPLVADVVCRERADNADTEKIKLALHYTSIGNGHLG